MRTNQAPTVQDYLNERLRAWKEYAAKLERAGDNMASELSMLGVKRPVEGYSGQ